MPRELFNSPQKQWVREHFWLPAILEFKARAAGQLKYLTFAGPKAFDVDFFTGKQIFNIENVRVWEMDHTAAAALKLKYGANFQVVVGQAFDLVKSAGERASFPHSVINLDFTNGAFHLKRPWYIPPKFELIDRVVSAQMECAESFLLLIAFAATHDVDNEYGKGFVQKLAFDIATRFGHTEPLFNLTRDAASWYPQILVSVVPCAVIRLGGEHSYDSRCIGKALYYPYGSKKTGMVCLMFSFTYDNPALSETSHQTSKRMDALIVKRQEESLGLPLTDVNKLLRSTATIVREPRRKRSRIRG